MTSRAFDTPLAPYGAALRDHHRGSRADGVLVVHSTLGEHDGIPVEVFFRGPGELFPFERVALELCRGRVLDLGAGTGVHSLILQDRGLGVLAAEVVPEAQEILRERGVREVFPGDGFALGEGDFDTVLMMMNGVGPVGTLEGLDRFLVRARRLLASGGQILLDSGPPVLHRDATDREGLGLDPDPDAYPGEARIRLEYEGALGPPFRELYVEEGVLAQRAGDAGWACSFLHRDETGSFLAQLLLPG